MASATRASGVHPPLTAEALQVIAAADQGGTPMFTSANLARIAKENGVDVSSDMTTNDIIAELRRRQQPARSLAQWHVRGLRSSTTTTARPAVDA